MAVPDDSMSWAPNWLQQFLGGAAPGGGVLQYPVQSGGGPVMGYGAGDPSSLGPMNPKPSVPPFKVGDISNWFRTHYTPDSHMGDADAPPAPQPAPQPQPQPGPQQGPPGYLHSTSAIPSPYPLSTTFPTGLGGPTGAPAAAAAAAPTPGTSTPYIAMPWRGPLGNEPGAPKPAAAAAPAKPAVVPNLGYYRPTVGNARGATFMPTGATGAPPIFRGPLAQGAGKDYYGGFFG